MSSFVDLTFYETKKLFPKNKSTHRPERGRRGSIRAHTQGKCCHHINDAYKPIPDRFCMLYLSTNCDKTRYRINCKWKQ